MILSNGAIFVARGLRMFMLIGPQWVMEGFGFLICLYLVLLLLLFLVYLFVGDDGFHSYCLLWDLKRMVVRRKRSGVKKKEKKEVLDKRALLIK